MGGIQELGGRPFGQPALALRAEPASGLVGSRFDQAQVFGIECQHHYGITTHDLPEDGDIPSAVYRMVRNWHPSLTDEDHTWEIRTGEYWSGITIRKNEKSPLFVIKPWWLDDGPGALWFSQEYRIATRASIQHEVDEHLHRAARLREEALREKPTKIGTKTAEKAWRYAEYAERDAAAVARRWPEFSGLPREGWQARLHEHRQPASAGETRRAETGTGSVREHATAEGLDAQGGSNA